YTNHKIETAKVEKDQIPDTIEWKKSIEEFPYKMGLIKAWEFASELSKDSDLKAFYKNNAGRLLNAVELRNNSLFAHGTKSISRYDYEKDKKEGMFAFTMGALKILKNDLPFDSLVFPTSLPENMTNG
ncbi:MAG: hypothetical protein SNJ70_08715, partial [Armatimonadota bacterium]